MKQETMIWLHIKGEESICVERGEAEDKALEEGYGYERTHEREDEEQTREEDGVQEAQSGGEEDGRVSDEDESNKIVLEELEHEELVAIAKEHKLKGYANMKRETLINKLLEL